MVISDWIQHIFFFWQSNSAKNVHTCSHMGPSPTWVAHLPMGKNLPWETLTNGNLWFITRQNVLFWTKWSRSWSSKRQKKDQICKIMILRADTIFWISNLARYPLRIHHWFGGNLSSSFCIGPYPSLPGSHFSPSQRVFERLKYDFGSFLQIQSRPCRRSNGPWSPAPFLHSLENRTRTPRLRN